MSTCATCLSMYSFLSWVLQDLANDESCVSSSVQTSHCPTDCLQSYAPPSSFDATISWQSTINREDIVKGYVEDKKLIKKGMKEKTPKGMVGGLEELNVCLLHCHHGHGESVHIVYNQHSISSTPFFSSHNTPKPVHQSGFIQTRQ